MKKIRRIRQFLQTRKSRLIDILLGLALGIILQVVIAGTAIVILKLPNVVMGTLLLLLFLTQSVTIAWLILLYEKYDQCKRYLAEHHPNIDLDSEDAFSDAFDEATKEK